MYKGTSDELRRCINALSEVGMTTLELQYLQNLQHVPHLHPDSDKWRYIEESIQPIKDDTETALSRWLDGLSSWGATRPHD